MTEPLPDAEWWPLKWSERSFRFLPTVEVRGYLVVDARGEQRRTGYCIYRRETDQAVCQKVKENIPDLLSLRAYLLKLAYPGGNYG